MHVCEHVPAVPLVGVQWAENKGSEIWNTASHLCKSYDWDGNEEIREKEREESPLRQVDDDATLDQYLWSRQRSDLKYKPIQHTQATRAEVLTTSKQPVAVCKDVSNEF